MSDICIHKILMKVTFALRIVEKKMLKTAYSLASIFFWLGKLVCLAIKTDPIYI